jgi:Holliday junction resolvase RusA-like endonuclease
VADQITLTVYGTPAPQGSKRAFAVRGKGGVPTGRIAVIESSHDRVKSWRQAVVDAADAIRPDEPLRGPLVAEMTFFMPRPKGHYRTGRNAGKLRDTAPHRPAGKPDLSKLLRATEDALTDVGLWGDDAQLVQYMCVAKCYADYRPPGALISVQTWTQFTITALSPEDT